MTENNIILHKTKLWNKRSSAILFGWLTDFPNCFSLGEGGGGGEGGDQRWGTHSTHEKIKYCLSVMLTTSHGGHENPICISCDSQKPMIMKQAWYFPCTLLVFKLCGPLQPNMLNCRNLSQTIQNLTVRYGWIQVFISHWLFSFDFVALLSSKK